MAKRKIPRFLLSRFLYSMPGILLAGGIFLLFLMLSAETGALDRAHHLNLAAIARLDSLMNSRHPEQVPAQIREMSSSMGGRTTLLDPGRKPAYRNAQILDKMQSFSRIPDTWFKSPHGPFVFPWPPDSVPEQLAEQASRISGIKGANHLLTNREGIPTPLQPVGGFAAWSTPVPNAPSCAQCHGFDSEILGYMVTFVPVPSILPDHRGRALWGFWPLPALNQKIIFSVAAVVSGILFAGLLLLEGTGNRRTFRRYLEKSSKSPQESPGQRSGSIRPSGEAEPVSPADLSPMDLAEKAALSSRLVTLDREIEKEIELLPHAGIQAPVDLDKKERNRETLERFSAWSDQAEMLLMDLKTLVSEKTDPLLAKSLLTLEKLKNEALDLNLALEDISLDTSRITPPYESLADMEKAWIEELRTALRHLHAEVRAIVGMLHNLPPSPPSESKG